MEKQRQNIWAHCGIDATKWGATDFYRDNEQALLAQLHPDQLDNHNWIASGGCKKEILSVDIQNEGRTVHCTVHQSNDFDLSGTGTRSVPITGRCFNTNLSLVKQALDEAADDAFKFLNECTDETLRMWVIGRADADGKRTNWIETYLEQVDWNYDAPPGDYYHKWQWQFDGTDPEAELSPAEFADLVDAGTRLPDHARKLFHMAFLDQAHPGPYYVNAAGHIWVMEVAK